jgi:hypothetical protein
MIHKFLSALALVALGLSVAAQAATRYVDPSNAASQDAGAGDAAHPYKTIHFAMGVLQSGDTLNMAGGTYRETMKLPVLGGAQTVIQPLSASAIVLIKGSDVVSGWQPLGNGVYVRQGWSTNSQQVFIDGVPLQQIGGEIFNMDPFIWPARVNGNQTNLVDSSFYYDIAGLALYIKTPLASLSGHTIEASVRTFDIFGDNVQNLTLRNLQLQHSNTTASSQNGAITLLGSNLDIDGLVISYADGAGTDITGDNNVVQNIVSTYNGQIGMKVRGNNNQVLSNTTNFNNTRGFNKNWEAGGVKFTGNNGLRNSEVKGHTSIGNNGDGIWFDWMNDSNKVHDSLSAYNTGFGIQYEASQRAYIYNNTIFGNKQRGIYLPCSSYSVVAYNLVVKNGLQGIAAIDDGRSATNAVLVPANNMFYGNIVAWSGGGDILVPAGALNNVSNYNVIVEATQPMFSAGWSPLIPGLANWQAKTGEDGQSAFVAQSVSSALNTAFLSGNARVDLSSLIALGSRVTVTQLSGNVPAQTRAGPLAQTMPGGTSAGATGGTNGGTPGGAATVDVLFVEDALPAGAVGAGVGEGWNWVNASPSPFSGATAHQSALASGFHQHYYYNATGLGIATGDKMLTYVFLDPANPPTEIMLQWLDGQNSWEHRAYWGANVTNTGIGVNSTAHAQYKGALPLNGQWIRLEVPDSQVSLEGQTVTGMAFTLYGGRATFDHSGKVTSAP